MAKVRYNHTTYSYVDKKGNTHILYPMNMSSDVELPKSLSTNNPNVPAGLNTLNQLLLKLSKMAFKEQIIAKDVNISSVTLNNPNIPTSVVTLEDLIKRFGGNVVINSFDNSDILVEHEVIDDNIYIPDIRTLNQWVDSIKECAFYDKIDTDKIIIDPSLLHSNRELPDDAETLTDIVKEISTDAFRPEYLRESVISHVGSEYGSISLNIFSTNKGALYYNDASHIYLVTVEYLGEVVAYDLFQSTMYSVNYRSMKKSSGFDSKFTVEISGTENMNYEYTLKFLVADFPMTQTNSGALTLKIRSL